MSESLQVKGVAYSSCSEIFVNGGDGVLGRDENREREKNVDNKSVSGRPESGRFSATSAVEKTEDKRGYLGCYSVETLLATSLPAA
jgi:hypothetical protein